MKCETFYLIQLQQPISNTKGITPDFSDNKDDINLRPPLDMLPEAKSKLRGLSKAVQWQLEWWQGLFPALRCPYGTILFVKFRGQPSTLLKP